MIYIILASVLLLFGTDASYGQSVQFLAVSLLVAQAFKLAAVNSFALNVKFDAFSLFLSVFIPLQSAIAIFFSDKLEMAPYSLVLLVACVCSKILADEVGIVQFLRIYVFSILIAAGVIIVFHFGDLIDSLSVTQTDKGLLRFSPFDNHPNLIGHIFGLGFIISAGLWFLAAPSVWRNVLVFSSSVSLLFVLAASSRGALLSALLSLSLMFWVRVYTKDSRFKLDSMGRLIVLAGVLVVLAFLMVFMSPYLYEMLDLNSEYRGIGSGGSGRLENWADFVNILIDSPRIFFIGSGLRTWDLFEIGFDTDNAYVNLFYEVGFFSGLVLFGFLIVKLYALLKEMTINIDYLPVFGVLVFIIIESVFARYMITAGNPASYAVLAVLLFRLPPMERKVH